MELDSPKFNTLIEIIGLKFDSFSKNVQSIIELYSSQYPLSFAAYCVKENDEFCVSLVSTSEFHPLIGHRIDDIEELHSIGKEQCTIVDPFKRCLRVEMAIDERESFLLALFDKTDTPFEPKDVLFGRLSAAKIKEFTELKKIAMPRSVEKLKENLLEFSGDLVLTIDLNYKILEANRSALQSLGYEKHELMGSSITELIPEKYLESFSTAWNALRISHHLRTEMFLACKNGAQLHTDVTATVLEDEIVLASFRDITLSKRHEIEIESLNQLLTLQAKQLEHANRKLIDLAHTDAMTNLPNHRAFQDRLKQQWQLSERTKTPISIIMLDIDHFKSVNDTYGHPYGDEVLHEAADCLKRMLREADILARYGGEEFVIILPDSNLAEAKLTAERLRSGFENCIFKNGKLTASFGVAQRTWVDANASDLVARADEALYEAKRSGRNRVCLGLAKAMVRDFESSRFEVEEA